MKTYVVSFTDDLSTIVFEVHADSEEEAEQIASRQLTRRDYRVETTELDAVKLRRLYEYYWADEIGETDVQG